MNTRRALFAVVLALFALAACASPGQVKADVWHSLNHEQQTEAQVVEQVLSKLVSECRAANPSYPCTPPKIIVTGSGTTPQYQRGGHSILVPAISLNPNPLFRATMAHEIGHAWWADASADCQSEAKAYMCEQNANYQAGHVLIVGYGYNDAAAVQMMWDQLVFMAQNGAKPSHGHPDACAELHAFERRVGRSPLYACEEKGR